ncbi:MAG: ZIP family metal transporter [Firmicutes bacterium]|nr:ZIP family metal transporter [Bacillota bacterium]
MFEIGLLNVIFIAFVSGAVGTTIGGTLGILVKKPNKTYIASMLAFAAGAMLGMALFEMAPESAQYGGIIPLLVGLGLGASFVYGFDLLFHKKTKDALKYNHLEINISFKEGEAVLEKRKLFKVGLAVFFAIILHDLPEGIAIGAGYHMGIGLLIGLVMLLHNIPEGLSIAVPLKAAGVKNFKIILIAFLAGIPTVLGAIIGYFLGANEMLISYTLAFAAGAMIYVVFSELLPMAYDYSKKNNLTTLLVIIGAVMIMVFAYLLH